MFFLFNYLKIRRGVFFRELRERESLVVFLCDQKAPGVLQNARETGKGEHRNHGSAPDGSRCTAS